MDNPDWSWREYDTGFLRGSVPRNVPITNSNLTTGRRRLEI